MFDEIDKGERERMEGQNYEGQDEYKEPVVVKTKDETDRKCPMCGGVMDFDPALGKLHCPYCDYVEDIVSEEEEETAAEELDFLSAENTSNCDWGVETKTVYCKSCGGEMVYDALEIAGECPYCGSNQVMEAKGENTLAPGGVCVFKLDAKQAAEKFKNWIKKRWFCPKEAKETAKPKDFKGVYLPYWTFDTQTTTKFTAEYGINRQKRNSKGETVTVTDWYNCSGTHREFVDDQTVCGTTRHEQGLLNGILPYDTADNKAYKPEYVAGFASERYSIGLKDAWDKAKSLISGRLKRNITEKIKNTYHADSVRSLKMSTGFGNIKYKYLLLPVWMACFKYKDKIYKFMVNGQTGKVSGKIPVSPVKVAITAVGVIAALALLWWIANL
jgi:predicted Zn-ribbon and HTH transcriptional regulator